VLRRLELGVDQLIRAAPELRIVDRLRAGTFVRQPAAAVGKLLDIAGQRLAVGIEQHAEIRAQARGGEIVERRINGRLVAGAHGFHEAEVAREHRFGDFMTLAQALGQSLGQGVPCSGQIEMRLGTRMLTQRCQGEQQCHTLRKRDESHNQNE
jgi:hypothetical protein